MFINGAALDPVPPVKPVWKSTAARGAELDSVDFNELQIAACTQQAATVPGVGAGSVECEVCLSTEILLS